MQHNHVVVAVIGHTRRFYSAIAVAVVGVGTMHNGPVVSVAHCDGYVVITCETVTATAGIV